MQKLWVTLGSLAVVALAVWLLLFRWADVGASSEAEIVILAPSLAAHHLLIRRRLKRQAAEQRGRAEAQAAQLAVVAERVGELHDLSIEGHLPARILKP